MAINLDPIRKVHQAAHPCVQYNIMKTSSSNIAMKLSVDRKICYRFFFLLLSFSNICNLTCPLFMDVVAMFASDKSILL